MKKEIPSRTKKGIESVPERIKVLNETQYFAVLATDDNGRPYASLVAYAFTPELRKVIFATPENTRKYKNILIARHVALLIDNRSNTYTDIMNTEAITVTGTAKRVKRGKAWQELAHIYIVKHPELEEFLNAPTTALMILEVEQCVHVGKFQTISVWNYR